MANEYLYGAYGHIGETVAQSAVQAGTTPVYIGTAPVNLVRGFGEAGIINAPIKITSLVDAQKKIGYSSDWGTFTLCEAVYAHFNNTIGNIGPIYVINVLDPSAGKHRKETATTKTLTFTGGRAEFASGRGGGWDSPQRIRCESIDGRSRSCPVDRRGEVRLVRQFSKAPCSEGYSWGRDRNVICVSRGCRAEFEVYGLGHGWNGGGWNNGGYDNGYGDGYGRTFHCESEKGRTSTCGVDGRGRVQLVRQLSNAACIEGRTWGRDARGVWVTDGCRAEFRSW